MPPIHAASSAAADVDGAHTSNVAIFSHGGTPSEILVEILVGVVVVGARGDVIVANAPSI
jgi:hypothetical protein